MVVSSVLTSVAAKALRSDIGTLKSNFLEGRRFKLGDTRSADSSSETVSSLSDNNASLTDTIIVSVAVSGPSIFASVSSPL